MTWVRRRPLPDGRVRVTEYDASGLAWSYVEEHRSTSPTVADVMGMLEEAERDP